MTEVNPKRISTVLQLIDKCKYERRYDKAIKLIKKEVEEPYKHELDSICCLYEHLAHIYSLDVNHKNDEEAFASVTECFSLQPSYDLKYAESYYILGVGIYKKGTSLDIALKALKAALNQEKLESELKEKIKDLINVIEKQELDHRRKKEEQEEASKKLAQELIAAEERQPRRGRKKAGDKLHQERKENIKQAGKHRI